MTRPTVLVTGAAVRLGQAIAEKLFDRGCNLVLHYNQSAVTAKALVQSFNDRRADSCDSIGANLEHPDEYQRLIQFCLQRFGRLDHLVNNASIFYPTPMDSASTTTLAQFLRVNFRAPLALARCAADALATHQGSIVNLLDIYADAGLAGHSFYVASKSALQAATRQLALELAPKVRVNAVSPGAILWPSQENAEISASGNNQQRKRAIVENSALKKSGSPSDIAETTAFLALDASYSTGSIIYVDGGRRFYI